MVDLYNPGPLGYKFHRSLCLKCNYYLDYLTISHDSVGKYIYLLPSTLFAYFYALRNKETLQYQYYYNRFAISLVTPVPLIANSLYQKSVAYKVIKSALIFWFCFTISMPMTRPFWPNSMHIRNHTSQIHAFDHGKHAWGAAIQ